MRIPCNHRVHPIDPGVGAGVEVPRDVQEQGGKDGQLLRRNIGQHLLEVYGVVDQVRKFIIGHATGLRQLNRLQGRFVILLLPPADRRQADVIGHVAYVQNQEDIVVLSWCIHGTCYYTWSNGGKYSICKFVTSTAS